MKFHHPKKGRRTYHLKYLTYVLTKPFLSTYFYIPLELHFCFCFCSLCLIKLNKCTQSHNIITHKKYKKRIEYDRYRFRDGGAAM